MKHRKLLCLLALLILFFTACQPTPPETAEIDENPAFYREWYEILKINNQVLFDNYRYAINEITPTLDSEAAEQIIYKTDKTVITAMKEKSFFELQKVIHPVKGVRISCYNEASTEDVVLMSDELLSNRSYVWGYRAGEGSEIEMSFAELFDTFLWNKEYSQYAPTYNPVKLSDSHSQARGNEYIFYDKCIVVLYLYEGSDEWVQMDWSGLKLIYQEHLDGNWYLTGIIHCEREM